MAVAPTLDEVPVCVTRAVERVKQKQRPARRGRVKDAMHWEHFLHLGGVLRQAGVTAPVGFVSSNEDDFWSPSPVPRGTTDTALLQDMADGHLAFYGRLLTAVDDLGL